MRSIEASLARGLQLAILKVLPFLCKQQIEERLVAGSFRFSADRDSHDGAGSAGLSPMIHRLRMTFPNRVRITAETNPLPVAGVR
jgi:hypothetical protein